MGLALGLLPLVGFLVAGAEGGSGSSEAVVGAVAALWRRLLMRWVRALAVHSVGEGLLAWWKSMWGEEGGDRLGALHEGMCGRMDGAIERKVERRMRDGWRTEGEIDSK